MWMALGGKIIIIHENFSLIFELRVFHCQFNILGMLGAGFVKLV
jgi:hypothetical protein